MSTVKQKKVEAVLLQYRDAGLGERVLRPYRTPGAELGEDEVVDDDLVDEEAEEAEPGDER